MQVGRMLMPGDILSMTQDDCPFLLVLLSRDKALQDDEFYWKVAAFQVVGGSLLGAFLRFYSDEELLKMLKWGKIGE